MLQYRDLSLAVCFCLLMVSCHYTAWIEMWGPPRAETGLFEMVDDEGLPLSSCQRGSQFDVSWRAFISWEVGGDPDPWDADQTVLVQLHCIYQFMMLFFHLFPWVAPGRLAVRPQPRHSVHHCRGWICRAWRAWIPSLSGLGIPMKNEHPWVYMGWWSTLIELS